MRVLILIKLNAEPQMGFALVCSSDLAEEHLSFSGRMSNFIILPNEILKCSNNELKAYGTVLGTQKLHAGSKYPAKFTKLGI